MKLDHVDVATYGEAIIIAGFDKAGKQVLLKPVDGKDGVYINPSQQQLANPTLGKADGKPGWYLKDKAGLHKTKYEEYSLSAKDGVYRVRDNDGSMETWTPTVGPLKGTITLADGTKLESKSEGNPNLPEFKLDDHGRITDITPSQDAIARGARIRHFAYIGDTNELARVEVQNPSVYRNEQGPLTFVHERQADGAWTCTCVGQVATRKDGKQVMVQQTYVDATTGRPFNAPQGEHKLSPSGDYSFQERVPVQTWVQQPNGRWQLQSIPRDLTHVSHANGTDEYLNPAAQTQAAARAQAEAPRAGRFIASPQSEVAQPQLGPRAAGPFTDAQGRQHTKNTDGTEDIKYNKDGQPQYLRTDASGYTTRVGSNEQNYQEFVLGADHKVTAVRVIAGGKLISEIPMKQ